jgi:hypothetical protein
MTTIERRPRRDIVPNAEVRAAIAWPFTSSAEPQTRLFWELVTKVRRPDSQAPDSAVEAKLRYWNCALTSMLAGAQAE